MSEAKLRKGPPFWVWIVLLIGFMLALDVALLKITSENPVEYVDGSDEEEGEEVANDANGEASAEGR